MRLLLAIAATDNTAAINSLPLYSNIASFCRSAMHCAVAVALPVVLRCLPSSTAPPSVLPSASSVDSLDSIVLSRLPVVCRGPSYSRKADAEAPAFYGRRTGAVVAA